MIEKVGLEIIEAHLRNHYRVKLRRPLDGAEYTFTFPVSSSDRRSRLESMSYLKRFMRGGSL